MASFSPQVSENAGEPDRARAELRAALRELGIRPSEDGDGNVHAEYTPGSYEPMPFRFWMPEELGVVAIEGEVLTIEGDPSGEVHLALNYLNVALDSVRYYFSGSVACVRQDILPSIGAQVWVHPRELRQVLTELCTQRKMFKDALERVQAGRPWSAVKDAVRAYR
jgi:hypothetical protein